MSPEAKVYDDQKEFTDTKKTENEGSKEQLEKNGIKPENAVTLKKLGFKEGEEINQKALEGKMMDQFTKMQIGVGQDNQSSQVKLETIKQEFLENLGSGTDINEQLKACREFLDASENASSTDKGSYAQRSSENAKKMNEEADANSKKTEQTMAEKLGKSLGEVLKKAEIDRKLTELKERIAAADALEKIEWPGNIKGEKAKESPKQTA